MPPRAKRQRTGEALAPRDQADAPLRAQENIEEQQDGDPQAHQRMARTDRRAGMAEIARRRAAHFAHFNEEGEHDETDEAALVHAGGTDIRTLGPWSSAVALVNERERAAERRRAKIQEAGGADLLHMGAGGDAAAGGSRAWAPKRDHRLGPRSQCAVPSLSAVCVRLLVEYIDCVESLYGVPDTIRTQLAAVVSARRKLSAEVAELFAADAPSELVLQDCTQLDREAMTKVIQAAATPKLERLELGMCGRGFGDNSLKRNAPLPAGTQLPEEPAEALARVAARCAGGQLPRLTHLRLAGAYRLNDEGLLQVLRVAPQLEHLAVPDGSRLTSALLSQLPRCTPHLRHLDLSGCRGLDAAPLAECLCRLASLTSLALDGIPQVDDGVLAAVARGCARLTSLSVCMCSAVTDAGVRALAASLPGLESFKCDKAEKVTDAGLVALAGGCPHLKVLSVRRVPKVTDQGLLPVIQRGCLEHLAVHGASGITDVTITQLSGHCHATLTHLDISFCRHISNQALGELVDHCTHLTHLAVFGCSQLDNVFAHGHTNSALLQAGGPVGLGTAVKVA